MTCDIKNNAVKSLAKLIRKILVESDTFGQKELKALVRKVSDMVEKENGDVDQAMTFARMVPHLVGLNMNLAPKLTKKIDGRPGFIYDLAYEFSQDNGLEAVERYLGVGEKVSSKEQRKIERETAEIEREELVANKRLGRIHRYEGVKVNTPPTFFATEDKMVDDKGEVLPDQLLNYNVLRKVLNKWNENPLENEDGTRRFSLSKAVKDVKLVAVTYGKLMETEEVSMKESDTYKPEDIVLVVSDQNGNYIRFDKDANLDEDGKVAYYGLYDYKKRGRDKSMLEFMAFSIYRREYSDLSDKQKRALDKEFAKQKKIIDFINKYLTENPDTELTLDLIGGSYGRSDTSNLQAVKFGTGKRAFKPSLEQKFTKVPRTPTYFMLDGEKYYFKSSEGLNKEDVETVMNFFFSPEIEYKGKKLTLKQRRDELNKIMYVGRSQDDTVLFNSKDLVIKIEDGETTVLARMEKGGTRTNVAYNKLNDISEQDNVKDIVRDHLAKVGFYNINKGLIEKTDVNMPVLKLLKSGNSEMSYDKIDYLDWLRSGRFIIDNPAGGKNPYFVFQPSIETEDIIYEEDPRFAIFKDDLPAKLREQMDSASYDEIPEEFKDAVEQAADRKNEGKVIDSSFFDGYKAPGQNFKYRFKSSILKKGYKGKNIMDLVQEGLSTRITLYENAFNILGKPKVGDYFYMGLPLKEKGKKTGKYTKEALVKVTAVYGKTDKRWEDNFYKEGWEDTVLDKMDKGFRVVEFEVVDLKPKKKKAVKVEDTKTPEPPKKPVGKKKVEKVEEKPKTKAKQGLERSNFIEDIGELEKSYDVKNNEIKATPEQIQEARTWWESSPLSKFIPFKDMMDIVNIANPNAVAKWSSAGIVLYKGADFSDIYHEAWHGFSQTFLSQEQRDKLYGEVSEYEGEFTDYQGNKVRFKEATELQLEEYLAESFRNYVLSNGVSTDRQTKQKMNIFKWLYNVLKEFFQYVGLIDAATPTEVFSVKTVFEKLRVGDISQFSHDMNKRSHGLPLELFHTIKTYASKSKGRERFNYKDTKLVIDSMDSVFSQYVDQAIERQGSHKYSVTAYKLDSNKMRMYRAAYNTFEKTLADLKQEYKDNKGKTAVQKEIKRKMDLVTDVLDNFGNLDSLEENVKLRSGVIYSHMMKSKILSAEDKEDFMQDVKESQTSREASYDRSGQDMALTDLAASEVIYLLKSLNEFTVDRRGDFVIQTNELGIPKLASFDKIWNLLARNLQNTLDIDVMYQKLVDLSEKNGSIAQLLEKMGSMDTKDQVMVDLWTKFWQAFNKTRVPLIQMNLNEREGDIGYEITLGYAQGEYRKVQRAWKDNFNSRITEYIKETPIETLKKEKIVIYKNFLDVEAVLDDFESAPVDPKDIIEFFNALGMKLDDTLDIREQIKNDSLYTDISNYIYNRLIEFEKYGVEINSLDDLFGEHEVSKGTVLSNMQNRFNDIAKLQAQYGDSVSNFMVSNAAGDTQFEHSLNNSMLVMSNTVNSVENEDELYGKAFMNHLDPKRNPWTKRAIWRNSLFSKKGDRKTNLVVENVSGVRKLELSGNYDGVKTAETDPFTKLVLDFHTMLLRGTPDLMKHADKGSSYTAYVENIKTYEGKKESHKYIDDADFLISHKRDMTIGEYQFSRMLHEYLVSEMERMAICRDIVMKKDEVFDYKYAERGSNFVVFDSILTEKTKARLDKLVGKLKGYDANRDDFMDWLNQNNADLAATVNNEILGYLDSQLDEVATFMEKAQYMDERVIKRIKVSFAEKQGKGVKMPQRDDIETAGVMSYIANSWIHNMESVIMLYGDLAQYDIAKEEFHKRNAGIASTGDLYRTDDLMLDFLEASVTDMYTEKVAERLNIDIPSQEYIARDGSIKTAVMADPRKLQVQYLDEYKDSLESYFKDRYKKDKEKRDKAVKRAVEAYTERKEGDAQGWISFDAYRKILVAEGKWDFVNQEALYKDIVEGKDVDMEKVIKFFPVKKVQYWGPLSTEGLPMMAMHKFSLMPLIPNVIKGTNLEKLHDRMVRQGIAYATFNTGSKISTLTDKNVADQFYSDASKREMDDSDFTPNTVFLQFLKDQLETGEEFKGKIPFPSQMRKLLIDSLVENGVPTDWNTDIKDADKRVQAWEKATDKQKEKSQNYKLYTNFEKLVGELTKTKYKELLEKIGWKIGKNGKPQGDQRALLDYIVLNLELQDIAAHELDFLQIGPDGRIKNDLSISFSAEKIERMLNAIVVKEIIRQKVKGESLIQVARTGWEKPTESDISKYGGDLPFYHKNPDGTTAAMKIKIAMQSDFKGLLNLDSVKERAESEGISRLQALNQLVKEEKWMKDNKKMVTMVAVRIPTQGINSMEFMEVYEFLPENAGNIIIMPSELVSKTGSDFDIDKMFTMMPHIFSKYGETRYLEHGKRISTEKTTSLMNQKNELEAQRREILREFDEKLESKEFKKNYPFDETQIASLKELNRSYYSRLKILDKKITDLENLEARRQAGKATQEVEQLIDGELYDAYTERDMLSDEFFENKKQLLREINREITDKIYKEQEAKLKPLNKKLFDITYDLKSSSSKGTENELLTTIRQILELESNFINLIKPNDTDIFNDLSQEMAQYTLEYDPKNGKENVSPTRALEVMYNLYKLDSNNVGKQVLGIGAVENTYNVLFNRIGMYMNHTSGMSVEEYMATRKELKKLEQEKKYYTKEREKGMKKPSTPKKELFSKTRILRAKVKNFAVQKLMLKHNTVTKDGKAVISLSNMYDANNEHRISDVISQMINGWVDVAKDTWIFNIGGNKELSPTILFMVQAGVPIKEAVYFAAQPIVREYVETQRLKKSTFAGPFGTEPEAESRFNYDSRLDMFEKYGIVDRKEFEKPNGDIVTYYDSTELYDKTQELLKTHKDAFTEEALKKRLDGFKKNGKVTNQDKAVFLHFLEVEDMAKALTAFKVTTNPDTSRARTLYEAAAKEVAIMNLKSNGRIPVEMVERVSTDTSIASFFDALGYQQDIWGPNFKVRTNQGLVNRLMTMMGGAERSEILEKTYQDAEKFANAYLNDFMVYMFQQKLYDFNLRDITSYKGAEGLSEKGKVTSLKYLPSGVVFDKGKFFVDKNKLTTDYDNLDNIQSDYEYAKVESSMFPKEDNYYKFVFEREYLRSLYDFPYIRETFLYQQRLEANLDKLGKKKTEEEIQLQTYEEVLRDMALKNTYNIKHMFEDSVSSMADTLELIKSEFPELVKNYEVLQSMGMQRSIRIKNIKLFDRSTDSESLSVYHENMQELMDPKAMRLDTSMQNKEMIASFFSKMPFYSIIQSGFDTNTMLSMQRIMPYDSFVMIMREAMDPITRTKNPIDISLEMADYYTGAFMQVNQLSTKKKPNPARGKYKDYNKVSNMTYDDFMNMDEEAENAQEQVLTTMVDYEGNPLFKITRRETEGVKAEPLPNYMERMAEDIRRNPTNIYVFNDVTKESSANISAAKQYDWILKKIKVDPRYSDISERIIGLPARRIYTANMADAIVPDSGAKPDALFMEKVDNAIDLLLEAKRKKMKIVFNANGYGQVLIGASERGVLTETKTKLAPKNFDYLSHQLLKHFGYVNKNYSNEEALLEIQEVVYTREDILDKIKFCFSR